MSNQTRLQQQAAASSSSGCLTILGLILVTLKLTETGVVATWPWWKVLIPFWAPFLIVLVIVSIFVLIAAKVSK